MTSKDTKLWIVDKVVDKSSVYPQIQEAAALLRAEEVVAFPTETVYGLGANAYSERAVEKIFAAKGRPSDNPLIVHISNKQQLQKLVRELPDLAEMLIEAFWPGPLTLVLHKGENIAERVTAGLSTVAVRMPDHPVALAVIEEAGVPIAAPSANVSGRPSPTTAQHVIDDLQGKIAGVVDGGATGVGVESTVLDLTTEVPVILRPGGITKRQLEAVVGRVEIDEALLNSGQAPRSPGVKYKHYAPKAKLVLVSGGRTFLQALVDKDFQDGKRVGILTTVENVDKYRAEVVLACGSREDATTVAQKLYDVLRTFDNYDLDIIYSEIFPPDGVGEAIMNRLEKAASGNWVFEK